MTYQYISKENPLGLIRIDHIEFTTQNLDAMQQLYRSLGFVLTQDHSCAKHDCYYYHQNDMDVILTVGKQDGVFQYDYQKKHGDGVCTLAFLVEDVEYALAEALKRGAVQAQGIKENELDGELYKTAAINGFGDVRNLLVQRSGKTKLFAPQFSHIENPEPIANGHDPKLIRLDHLTNNVYYGDMEKWVKFYKDIYGMLEVRYFDIKGIKTGLFSKVVCTPDRSIIIPINEPDEKNGKGQIQEYLDMHKGEGVQHIAMTTENIVETVRTLKRNGFQFLDINEVYYEMLPDRVANIDKMEDLDALKAESILVDGDEKEYLLQIFTSNQVGPLFFEIICRKGHDGFGEGNFQALFDSIERDQEKRGVFNN
ncbi:MAG: 4-hydroxyphenylpyruvate dioxygenase [Calditrichaeota bacterium]|nr:4-hydroxyphenylpyruvate dioxygenase [Calditrichota bacterium]